MRAQSGKKISEEHAEWLIAEVERIKGAISC